MKNMFITNLNIENVRHLKNIQVALSEDEAKHLILTGKNGSGKTSVLDGMSRYLNTAATSNRLEEAAKYLARYENELKQLQDQGIEDVNTIKAEKKVERYRNEWMQITGGVSVEFNESAASLNYCFEKGQFILAYYKAERVFKADVPKHVEKIELKDRYLIDETPRQVFVKYLLDLKVTEALARNSGKEEKASEIKQWFEKFQELLRTIFSDDSLELIFEEDTFSFFIKEKNRELFDFNSLSSGFAAVLDIVLDIIVRMEKVTNKTFSFCVPGIVLIDEIETHLHLELQKNVLKLLTTVFPNIQFVVSTHSPFILSSLENAVIYDLENKITVENGLVDVPYSGIVEGYFKSSEMSASLRRKYERYKLLVAKEALTDDDFEEIAELEMYLNEIPDYLALNITTEYQRLKLQFEAREDI